MKRLISSFAALVAVACLVSACGQKGPLYLPEDGDNGKAHTSHQHQPKAKSAPAQEQQPELQSESEPEPEQSPAQ
ncbi:MULTISPECIES: LPS translocon maturation chaperone LptM [unclassified Pseudomonas]|uniref:LPS translocon maturation chaperone LptM n=1 Tax=unclassified Pseudomonas TaxID=196821 RepID=UPI003FA1A5A7